MQIHENRAEPNLTPLLDMVFQLITFFMLVINFKGAEMDLSLQLPVLGSAQPMEDAGAGGLLVLNIDAEGRLKVYGNEVDFKDYIPREARLMTDRLVDGKKFKKGDPLPTTVVIRADRTTAFHLLNDIVRTCQKSGFRKFSLMAVNRREGG